MTVFGYNDSATILQYVLYIRVVGTVEHPATTAPMLYYGGGVENCISIGVLLQ